MRFLIDAQLPPILATVLSERGHVAYHVLDLGLVDAPDMDIWLRAAALDAILISKDEDFINLHRQQPGGKLIWARIGNTSRRALLNWFLPLLPEIERLIENGETLIEIQ